MLRSALSPLVAIAAIAAAISSPSSSMAATPATVSAAEAKAVAAKGSAPLLTPDRLVQAPRPGSFAASPDARRAVVGVSTFDLSLENYTRAVYTLPLDDALQPAVDEVKSHGHLAPAIKGVASASWLSAEELLWVDEDKIFVHGIEGDAVEYQGKTESSSHGTPKKDDATTAKTAPAAPKPNPIATLPTNIETYQLKPLASSGGRARALLVFSAQVYDDGKLETVRAYEESKEGKVWERAKVYDSLLVRHWDTWERPGKRSQLFAVELERGDAVGSNSDSAAASWKLVGEPRNIMQGTKLRTPVPPFGDEGDYAVHAGAGLVAWTARDPGLVAAWHTKQNIYIAPTSGKGPVRELTKGEHGATSAPKFSRDGAWLAWLQMARDGYESDKRVVTLHHLESGRQTQLLADWDRSPSAVHFSADAKRLLLQVEEWGQGKLMSVEVELQSEDGSAVAKAETLREVVSRGTVGSVEVLDDGRLLLGHHTYRGPSDLYAVAAADADGAADERGASRGRPASARRLTDFAQSPGSSLRGVDLGPEPVHFEYEGAGGRSAYGWLYPPPGYDETRKAEYPLCLLIHGGPEGAWTDSWSTRWNPAAFSTDFFGVSINPAGSTGYGQAFQEEIKLQWGGKPYEDLLKGVEHVLRTTPAVDPKRTVAAGASYGGFMVNWIQGHNDPNGTQVPNFQALVSHDGVFSTLSTFYATEELYFPEWEFGGVPWQEGRREEYLRWSPETRTSEWKTPQLTVAGSKDYRLPEVEGLSVFNTLQRRGVPSKLVVFPSENHWVNNPLNSKVWHDEILAFLRKYAGRRAGRDAEEEAGVDGRGESTTTGAADEGATEAMGSLVLQQA